MAVHERHVTIVMPGANDLRIREEHTRMAETLIQLEAYLESNHKNVAPETARRKLLEMLRAGLPETLQNDWKN